ncbi:hypothetical protein Hdeb2414_s0774g00945571 [Helianthus debilis subsp. tardiflorus]
MSFCFNDKYVFNINQSHVKKKHQKWAEYMLTQMIHFCKWKQHMDPLFGTRSHIKTTHRSPWDIPETPTGGQSRCRDRDHVDIISFTVSVCSFNVFDSFLFM